MITDKQTKKPIINVYKDSDVKDFHLKKTAEPEKVYYFDVDSRDATSIDLQKSFILPYTKDQFWRIVISGASGSGKSTLLSNLCSQFIHENTAKKSIIIYVSALEHDKYLDETFKKIGDHNIIKLTHKNFINLFNNKPAKGKKQIKAPDEKQAFKNDSFENNILKRGNLTKGKSKEDEEKKKKREEMMKRLENGPFTDLDSLREFVGKYFEKREVLLCFDDCEAMPSSGNFKLVKQLVLDIQHQILTAGRSHKDGEPNINFIGIVHNIISGDVIRVVRTYLNEANYMALSLKATSKGMIHKIVEKYGLIQFEDELNRLKLEGEGMCFISLQYPFYIACNSKIIPIQ